MLLQLMTAKKRSCQPLLGVLQVLVVLGMVVLLLLLAGAPAPSDLFEVAYPLRTAL